MGPGLRDGKNHASQTRLRDRHPAGLLRFSLLQLQLGKREKDIK